MKNFVPSSSEEIQRNWVFVGRCLTDDNPDNEWFKADVTEFINGTIKRHSRGRYSYGSGSGGSLRHCHVRGVCDPVLFPVCNKSKAELKADEEKRNNKKKKKKNPKLYDNDGEPEPHPHPPPIASCASVGYSVYMVGGSLKMVASRRAVADFCGSRLPKLSVDDPPLTREEANNDCHVLRECHLDVPQLQIKESSCEKVDPRWVASARLCSPRHRPKAFTIGNKIYLVGGNAPPYSPEDEDHDFFAYAEVFDPVSGACSPLPRIPFPRINTGFMNILPLLGKKGEQKFMLFSKGCAVNPGLTALYDINLRQWHHWTFPPEQMGRGSLSFHIEEMFGVSVPVAEQNTTYWISGRFSKKPYLCAFNWKSHKLYLAPFLVDIDFDRKPQFLHHLTGNFFCFIWEEFHERDEVRTSNIHFTLLRISKIHSTCSLDIRVLGCICHVIEGYQNIYNTLLLSN